MSGLPIQSQVALVTGANRGIGRALVEALLARGAKRVYATARTAASLTPLVALDRARVRPLTLDITNPADVARAADAAPDVSLLFNNAGALAVGSLLDAPLDGVRRDMEVNYFGTLGVSRAFAPIIERNGGGGIVNVLSIVSLASMPGIGGYNASKAAAWSLTLSLRAELGPRGVSVFGVFPGPIDTDMAKVVTLPKTAPQALAEEVLAGIEAGLEDIFPDPMSKQVYAAWAADHKAVEKQFASQSPG